MTNINQADVQMLLDKNAIEELVYQWDYLTDERVSSDDVIDSFCTEDVIYDAGPLGRTEGKEAFKEAAREIWDKEPFIEGVPGELNWQPESVEQ
jgi:hypothetical protein